MRSTVGVSATATGQSLMWLLPLSLFFCKVHLLLDQTPCLPAQADHAHLQPTQQSFPTVHLVEVVVFGLQSQGRRARSV